MSSSSWHLIREAAAPAAEPADPAVAGAGSGSGAAGPAAPQPGAANVFRGRARPTLHGGSAAHPGTPGGSGLPNVGIAATDPAELAEEVRRIERAAEERGYETGRRRAENELASAIEAAGAIADQLHAVAPERTSEIAHSIAELALSVARRILQHEVRLDPTVLCTALEQAVATINGSPEAHVLLNPAAVAPVQQAWEVLHGRAYLGKRWLFEGDPTLPPGGCVVHYEHGFVDAGLEAQLEEIGIALDRAIPSLARTTVEEDVA